MDNTEQTSPEEQQNTAPEQTSPPVSTDSPVAASPVVGQPGTGGKKKKLILAALLLIVFAGALLYWFVLRENAPAQNNVADVPATTDEQPAEQTLKPAALLYATTKVSSSTSNDCGEERTHTLHRLAFDAEEPTDTYTAGPGNYLDVADVKENHVLIQESAGCGSNDSPKLMYSADSGKTFTKVYEGRRRTGNSSIGEQLTSVVLATDKSSVLVGVLPEDGKNTVKEINLETKEVKDVFEADQPGVFLKGYDKASGIIYYGKGCYNCDGNSDRRLYSFNLSDKKESLFYEYNGGTAASSVINKAFTKALILTGSEAGGLYNEEPFKVVEMDLKTKKTTTLLGNHKSMISVGYRDGDELPYYVDGNKILPLGTDDDKSPLFESSRSIYDVLYVGREMVITSQGDYQDFLVSLFTPSDNKSKSLLSHQSTDTNYVYGVVWE